MNKTSNSTNFTDLQLFLAIVRRRSFSAAAIEFHVTPSAASHAMRRLEDKLGAKLLNRTSRSVMPTELGQDLANTLAEGFDTIQDALHAIKAPGAANFGELRINAFSDAAHLLISPALPEFVDRCPDVKLSIAVDEQPVDIVREGFDAGIRYGHHVPADMVSVPLTGIQRWVVVGSPKYLERQGYPQTPWDLSDHNCLQLQLGDGSNYSWELCDNDTERSWKVPGNITIKDTVTTIAAAKAGLGLAYVLEARVTDLVKKGILQIVLEEYAPTDDPFHMYYGSRRHNHPGLRALTNIIRTQNNLRPI